MSKHTGEKNKAGRVENYCEHCNKYIQGSSSKFRSHLYRHGIVKPRFYCQHCPTEFFRTDAYKRHISKHTGIYKKVFVCDYCDRSFVDKRNLLQHLKVHDDSLINHPKLSYRCQVCNISYAEERCLKHHIRRIHSDFKHTEPVFVNKSLNETWVETVLDSKICVEVKKLNNNVITIKKCEEGKEQDDIAKMGKDVVKYFKLGKDTSQYSMAVCDYCKKEMLKKSLRLHIKERHMKMYKFKCDVCKKGYNRHYLLVNHNCGGKRKRMGPKQPKIKP